jgi:hypothetical protein
MRRGNCKVCGNLCPKYGAEHCSVKCRYPNPRSHWPEHAAWKNMLRRCYDKDNAGYLNYGGRGITVCDQWCESFDSFINDMGRRPSSKHSLDRKDNNGSYSPDNCRWATSHEQLLNTRRNYIIEFNGVKLTFTEWLERTGLSHQTLKHRLYRGWSVERALTTPQGKYTK